LFNLEKPERLIIIFLACILLLGIGVSSYNRSHPAVDVKIGKFDPASVAGEPAVTGKININTSGTEELSRLAGIGTVLAGRIIAYRSSEGPFASVEDIKKVKGVGPALFEKIKDDITAE